MRDGYDSATGRYTQSDPKGLVAGVNTYSYVNSAPISESDAMAFGCGGRSLQCC
jgi:RHS repeat-associated protein